MRLPVDLSKQAAQATRGHRLDVVLSRLRNEPSRRLDEELTLDRRFVLPDQRSFLVSGTARIEPNASDATIDTALGTTAPGTQYTASSHLEGDADARASRAFDHDPSTAWTPGIGDVVSPWIDVALPAAETVDHLQLSIVADRLHSVPSQFTLIADGTPARTVPIPTMTRSARDGTVKTRRHPVRSGDRRQLQDPVRHHHAVVHEDHDPTTTPCRSPSPSPTPPWPACRCPRHRPPSTPAAGPTS